MLERERLVQQAIAARQHAYAPYSGFAVGAALLTTEGRAYTGCNVENASYGLTICAERTALAKAVSEGERRFVALAVVAEGAEYCVPCGACRQVLAEFNPDLEVIMARLDGQFAVRSLRELLPEAFAWPRREG